MHSVLKIVVIIRFFKAALLLQLFGINFIYGCISLKDNSLKNLVK